MTPGAGMANRNRLAALVSAIAAFASAGALPAQETWDLATRPASFTLYAPPGWRGNGVASGDFDGDGIADLGVGGLVARVWSGQTGLAGSVDLATRTPPFAASGDQALSSVAFGDLNADGIEDLVLADPGYGDPVYDGIVYVFMGRREEPVYRRIGTNAPDLTVQARVGCSFLGMYLATGDVSGDGVDDLVAAGRGVDAIPCWEGGEVVVVFGRPGLNGVVGPAGIPWDAWTAGPTRFTSLAVGDVTGDATGDIVLGAEYEGASFPGQVWIYRGGPALAGEMDPVSPDALILGAEPTDYLGSAVAVGDLNGDTVGDIAAGASGGDGPGNACPSTPATGEVAVVFGGPGLTGLRDLAVDPPDSVVYPPTCGDGMGRRISAADWTGDGVDDLLLAATAADGPGEGRADCGEAYVVAGGAGLAGPIDLGVVAPALTAYGGAPGEALGEAVAGGDMDADGSAELIVRSRRADPGYGARPEGATVYAFSGARAPTAATILRSAGDPSALLPHATPAGSPYDDAPGLVGDGVLYFYRIDEGGGPGVQLTVSRNWTSRTIRLSWNDGSPGSAIAPDPVLSSVTIQPACLRPDGLTDAEVRVVPRDSNGDLLGAGLTVELDATALSPGHPAGSFEDLHNGTYVASIVASTAGTGTVRVTVEGVALATAPVETWDTGAPSATIAFVPSFPGLGDMVTFTPSVTGGTPPYSFRWDLNGDGVADSTAEVPEITYSREGHFAVTVRVTDTSGCGSVASDRIPIAP